MANSGSVVEALRRSKKGQLKYEPRGFAHLQDELLDLKRRRNSLAFGYPYEKFSEIASREEINDNSNENPKATSLSQNDETESTNPESTRSEITVERLWDIEIMNYEEQYRQEAQKAIDERKLKFLEHSKKLMEDQKRKVKAIEVNRDMELRLQREEYLAQLEARKEEMVQLKRIQRESLARSKKLMKEKIKQAEYRQKKIDEETQEMLLLKKQQEDMATTVHQCEKEMNVRHHEMAETLRHCSAAGLQPESIKEDVVKCNDVITAFTRIVNAANSSSLTTDDVTEAASLVQEFDECIKKIMSRLQKQHEDMATTVRQCEKEMNLRHQEMAEALRHCSGLLPDSIKEDVVKYNDVISAFTRIVNAANTLSLTSVDVTEAFSLVQEFDECIKKIMLRLEKQHENMATTVRQCEKEMNLRYQEMAEALRNCSDAGLLPESIREDVVKFNDVITAFTRIVKAANSSSLTIDDMTKAVNLVQEFDECIKNMMLRLKKQQENMAATVHQCENEMNMRYHKMVESLGHCSNASFLLNFIKEDAKYNDVITAFNRILYAANTSSLTSDDVTKAVSLVQEFEECIKNIMDATKKMNEQQDTVTESSMSLYQAEDDQNMISDSTSIDTSSQALPIQNRDNVVNAEQTSSLQLPDGDKKNSAMPNNYSECLDDSFFVTPKILEEDLYLQNILKSVQNSYEPLKKDKKAAKYRFHLEKAVNISLNRISASSGQQVKDRLERLRKLLSGQPVFISNCRVSTRNNPMAISFCKDLLAKKIVKQGEEQVSCNHEAAFSIAATVVSLWIDFPDFGNLLLAHFHQKCPFIIPFYIPQIGGQTQEEHYKALGYNYIDGTVKEQDNYLKRMSGIMRLYSAILCTRLPHGMNRSHPHGIEHGWKWMARILNLEPRVDITATMLYDFLQTAGFAMEATNKNQFEKLMYTLCEDFFPKLKSVSAGGTGEPITRLENFLKNYRINRRIPKPSGMLSENFWFPN